MRIIIYSLVFAAVIATAEFRATQPMPRPAITIDETKLSESGQAVGLLFREVEKGALTIKELHLLQRIAKAESDKRQHKTGGSLLRGYYNPHDIGYFQINEIHHGRRAATLGFDIFTLEGNVGYAVHLYKTEGAKPWNWSIGGWKR